MKLPIIVWYRYFMRDGLRIREHVPSIEVVHALTKQVALPPDDTDGLVLKCAGCSSTLGRKWKIYNRVRASDRELPAFCPACGQKVLKTEG